MKQYQAPTSRPKLQAQPTQPQVRPQAQILPDLRSVQHSPLFFPKTPIDSSSGVAQLSKWTWDGKKWTTDDPNADYSKKPVFSGKKHGQVYDDAPQQEEEEKSDPAHLAKMEKIQPYLNLLNHLAGEAETSSKGKVTRVTGGHLLTDMQQKWNERLAVASQPNQNAVWHTAWSIDGVEKRGGSTMFPASWTQQTLRTELLNSHVVGQTITLQPSGIVIHKSGSTFYPEQ